MVTVSREGLPPALGLDSHQPLLFAAPVLFLLIPALVILLLPFREADLDLDPAVLVVHVEGEQGIARALHAADQAADLPRVQQELARAYRIRSEMSGDGGQGADMAADQKDLAVVHDHVCFLDLHPPGAYRLHFPALERDPGLEAFLEQIIVESLPVLDDAHCGGKIGGHAYSTSGSPLFPHTSGAAP